MNIIETPYNINLVTVPTEEQIGILLTNEEDITSDYNYVNIYIASCIKKYGVEAVQEIINPYLNSKNFFVNQHIDARKLNFQDSLVFSTHSSKDDDFISIPHYTFHSTNLDVKKDILFSFIGSTRTHWTRKQLVEMYETCVDSGVFWAIGLELSGNERARLKSKYVELVNRSIFSLCPRGSGCSTIRLFEVMSMGSIPVIISDGYKLPLSGILDWDKFSVIVPESKIGDIDKILSKIGDKEIKDLQKNLRNIYSTYFSNDNLHRTIIYKIKNL